MEGVIRKQLLYRTGVEYGDYALNHVLGCAHGCKYPCYAFLMNRRFRNISYDDWIKPKLVDNTIELLEKELPKLRGKAKYINMCFCNRSFYVQSARSYKTLLRCDCTHQLFWYSCADINQRRIYIGCSESFESSGEQFWGNTCIVVRGIQKKV